MVLAVTPGVVAPPLSAPSFHGFTHGSHAWYTNFTRSSVLSHCGLFSAAGVPTPLSSVTAAPALPLGSRVVAVTNETTKAATRRARIGDPPWPA